MHVQSPRSETVLEGMGKPSCGSQQRNDTVPLAVCGESIKGGAWGHPSQEESLQWLNWVDEPCGWIHCRIPV